MPTVDPATTWAAEIRAVQITRFGGPEVLGIVDVPDATPGDGQQLYDVSTAGLTCADAHHIPTRQLSLVSRPV
jgi:NADPH:quinone reductase